MSTLFKYISGITLVAAGIAMWVYTPWWVWAAALVMAGLGILRFGGLISYLCLGAAAILLLFGYAVQPDAISIFELLGS